MTGFSCRGPNSSRDFQYGALGSLNVRARVAGSAGDISCVSSPAESSSETKQSVLSVETRGSGVEKAAKAHSRLAEECLIEFPQAQQYKNHRFSRMVVFGSGTNSLTLTKLSANTTGFAMALGGTLDIRMNHMIDLRPIEVDYFLTRVNNAYNQNNLR
jgi:hypothetical protein